MNELVNPQSYRGEWCEVSALKVNKTVQHDSHLVLGGFKDYYSNLAGNLLKKLPKPSINLP